MTTISTFAFIDGLGGGEVLMIAFVALLLFGGKNLPSLARTMGRTMREFKKASSEVEREIRKAIDEAPDTDNPSRPQATVAQGQAFPSQPPLPADRGHLDAVYEDASLSSYQSSALPSAAPEVPSAAGDASKAPSSAGTPSPSQPAISPGTGHLGSGSLGSGSQASSKLPEA